MTRVAGHGEGTAVAPSPRVPDILDTPQAGPAAIRGGALRVAAFAAGLLVTAGSTVLLLRYLSVPDYGRYVTVISLVTIVAGVTDAGMTEIGVREFSVRHGEDRMRLMRNLLGVRVLVTTAGIAVAVAFAVAAGYTNGMVAGTALAGAALWLLAGQAQAQAPLQASLQLGWVSLFEFLRPLLTVAFLVALVLAGAPLVALLAVPLPVFALVLAMTVPVVRGRVPFRPAYEPAEWRSLLALVAPFAAVAAVSMVYVYVTVVLFSLVATDRETGLFGASFRIYNTLYQVPFVFATSAFPILARAAQTDLDRLRRAVERLLEASLLVGVALALAVVFSARVVLDVLAGPEYRDAALALRLQGGALVASFAAAVGGYALLSLRRNRAVVVTNAVALGVTCLLTLVLGPLFGAAGAASANVVGEVVLIAGYTVALSRDPARIRLNRGRLARLAAATALAAAVGIALSSASVAAALASCATFCAASFVLGLVPREARGLLRGGSAQS